VLSHDLINLTEFKIGTSSFNRDAVWQTEQYALDIRDLHAESKDRKIVPFLVATNAKTSSTGSDFSSSQQINEVVRVNVSGLSSGILEAFSTLSPKDAREIGHQTWDNSSYRPTPWIVEVA